MKAAASSNAAADVERLRSKSVQLAKADIAKTKDLLMRCPELMGNFVDVDACAEFNSGLIGATAFLQQGVTGRIFRAASVGAAPRDITRDTDAALDAFAAGVKRPRGGPRQPTDWGTPATAVLGEGQYTVGSGPHPLPGSLLMVQNERAEWVEVLVEADWKGCHRLVVRDGKGMCHVLATGEVFVVAPGKRSRR